MTEKIVQPRSLSQRAAARVSVVSPDLLVMRTRVFSSTMLQPVSTSSAERTERQGISLSSSIIAENGASMAWEPPEEEMRMPEKPFSVTASAIASISARRL